MNRKTEKQLSRVPHYLNKVVHEYGVFSHLLCLNNTRDIKIILRNKMVIWDCKEITGATAALSLPGLPTNKTIQFLHHYLLTQN